MSTRAAGDGRGAGSSPGGRDSTPLGSTLDSTPLVDSSRRAERRSAAGSTAVGGRRSAAAGRDESRDEPAPAGPGLTDLGPRARRRSAMAQPSGPAQPVRRRTGWWGWNGDSNWDDQGCLGCGLAWWIVALCAVFVFAFWGWGVPGWGGWGGWGWRHNYNYNTQCPPGAYGG